MNRANTRRARSHPSYERHRRQVWTTILLPIIVAVLIVVGASVMLSVATFQGNGDVVRWAAISTIGLAIPPIIVGLIALGVLLGLIYLVARITGIIPTYSFAVQRFFQRAESVTKRGAAMVRKPMLAVREIGQMVRGRLQKARERM